MSAIEIDRPRLERAPSEPREPEQDFDEVRHAVHGAADGVEELPALVVEAGVGVLAEQSAVAGDVPERCPQVVRHGVGEGVQFAIRRLELGRARLHALLELLIDPNVLHRHSGRVGQRLQQLEGAGRGDLWRRPIGADGANRIRFADRHHDQALHKRRSVGVDGDSRVAEDVRHRRRLSVEHRPAADARRQREALALPQRTNRVLVHVVAELAVAQHERRAVGLDHFPGGAAHDGPHALDVARHRQVLDGADQPPGVVRNVRLIVHRAEPGRARRSLH